MEYPEEILRRMDSMLEKQERMIEELFRHSHQQDLILMRHEQILGNLQEMTRILSENAMQKRGITKSRKTKQV